MKWFIFLCLTLYAGLFGYRAMTRVEAYHTDLMNYIDVAKHIKTNSGIVQSTLGFNQPNFSVENDIPSYFVNQPPLYPIVIALASYPGWNETSTAFILTSFCYAIVLFLSYLLAAKIYDPRVAMLSVILLVFYEPLRHVVDFGLSEPLACIWMLLSLYMLLDVRAHTHLGKTLLIGCIAGLALATRYAFLPLVIAETLFLLMTRTGWRQILTYILGFSIPAGLIFGRNFIVSGHLITSPNPSPENFFFNLYNAVRGLLGEYSTFWPEAFSATVWALILLFITLFLCIKIGRKAISELVFTPARSILLIWPILYVLFLVLQRSVVFFDQIDMRLIMPAGVTLIILWAALFLRAFPLQKKTVLILFLIAILAASSWEIAKIIRQPIYQREFAISHSGILSWISHNTTKDDLIIGNGTVEIPFVFSYPDAISFSYYPDTEYVDEEKIQNFLNKHPAKYKHIYLIFRTSFDQGRDFGPFIEQLTSNPNSKEPKIHFIQKFNDGYIFEIIP